MNGSLKSVPITITLTYSGIKALLIARRLQFMSLQKGSNRNHLVGKGTFSHLAKLAYVTCKNIQSFNLCLGNENETKGNTMGNDTIRVGIFKHNEGTPLMSARKFSDRYILLFTYFDRYIHTLHTHQTY